MVEDEELPQKFCRSFELLFPNIMANGASTSPLLSCLRSQGMRALATLLSAHPELVHTHGTRLFPVILKPLNLAGAGQQVMVQALSPFLPDMEVVAPISLPSASTVTAWFGSATEIRDVDSVAFCKTGTRTALTHKESYTGVIPPGTTIKIPSSSFDLVWKVGNSNSPNGVEWSTVIKGSSAATLQPDDGSIRELLYDLGSSLNPTLDTSGSSNGDSASGKQEEKCHELSLSNGPLGKDVFQVTVTDMDVDKETSAKGVTEYWVKVAGRKGQEEFPLQVGEEGITHGELRSCHDSIYDCMTPSSFHGEGQARRESQGCHRASSCLIKTQAQILGAKREYIDAELTSQALECLTTLVVAWLKDIHDLDLTKFGGGIVAFFEVLQLLMAHGNFSREVLPYLRDKLRLIRSGLADNWKDGRGFINLLTGYALKYMRRKCDEDTEKRLMSKLLPVLMATTALGQQEMTLTFVEELDSSLRPSLLYLAQGSVTTLLRPGGLLNDQGIELSWVLSDLLYQEVASNDSMLGQIGPLMQALARCLNLIHTPDIRLVYLLTALLSMPNAAVPEVEHMLVTLRRITKRRLNMERGGHVGSVFAEHAAIPSPSLLLKALIQAVIVGTFLVASAPSSDTLKSVKQTFDGQLSDLWKLTVAMHALTSQDLVRVKGLEGLDVVSQEALHQPSRLQLRGLVEKVNTVAKTREYNEERVLSQSYSILTGEPALAPPVAAAFTALQQVNRLLHRSLPFIDMDLVHHKWSLANLLARSKGFIFTPVKLGNWRQALKVTDRTSGTYETLTLNRQTGVPLFQQAFQKLHPMDPHKLRRSDRAYFTKLEGEQGIDDGGLYRQSFADYCAELQSSTLPYLEEPWESGKPFSLEALVG